jgi:hypothetical protein
LAAIEALTPDKLEAALSRPSLKSHERFHKRSTQSSCIKKKSKGVTVKTQKRLRGGEVNKQGLS